MYGPRCEYCRHHNHPGADFCEACEFPLGGAAAEGEQEAAGEPSAPQAPADDIPAPPFKGVGDVFSPMLAVYRQHFTLVGILVLVATLPQALIQYGVLDLMNGAAATVREGGDPRDVAILAGVGVFNLLIWLLGVLGGALLSGSLVFAVVDLQRAGRASARECLARGLKALPKVFVVMLLYSVITLFGFVMLVVPGVIFSLMFAVSVPAAVVEGCGIMDALKRSYELTKGYKGLLFITYFLWGVLVGVTGLLVAWSFADGGGMGVLPTLLLQTAVLGMLNSSADVLTVYIYLGLRRERRGGFNPNIITP